MKTTVYITVLAATEENANLIGVIDILIKRAKDFFTFCNLN